MPHIVIKICNQDMPDPANAVDIQIDTSQFRAWSSLVQLIAQTLRMTAVNSLWALSPNEQPERVDSPGVSEKNRWRILKGLDPADDIVLVSGSGGIAIAGPQVALPLLPGLQQRAAAVPAVATAANSNPYAESYAQPGQPGMIGTAASMVAGAAGPVQSALPQRVQQPIEGMGSGNGQAIHQAPPPIGGAANPTAIAALGMVSSMMAQQPPPGVPSAFPIATVAAAAAAAALATVPLSDGHPAPAGSLASGPTVRYTPGGHKAVFQKPAHGNGSAKGPSDGQFSCGECGKRFRRRQHMQRHHTTKHTRRVCPWCHREFTSDPWFEKHKLSHAGQSIAAEPHACTACNLNFATLEALHIHKKSDAHKYRYLCTFGGCGRRFTQPKKLEGHLRVHTGEKPHVCNVCQKAYGQLPSLRVHVKVQHSGAEKTFACTQCDSKFLYQHLLTVHLRVHTQEQPYHCKFCDLKFTWNNSYHLHMRLHTGFRPYACDVQGCGQKFSRSDNMKVHRRKHTGETPYACDGCGKAFSIKGNMLVHKMIHANDKPFECSICQKRFNRNTALRQHQLRHGKHRSTTEATEAIATEQKLASAASALDDLDEQDARKMMSMLEARMRAKGYTRPHSMAGSVGVVGPAGQSAAPGGGHPDPGGSEAGMPAASSAVVEPGMGVTMDAMLGTMPAGARSRGRPSISRAAASQPELPLPHFVSQHSQQPPPNVPAPAPAPAPAPVLGSNRLAVMAQAATMYGQGVQPQ